VPRADRDELPRKSVDLRLSCITRRSRMGMRVPQTNRSSFRLKAETTDPGGRPSAWSRKLQIPGRPSA